MEGFSDVLLVNHFSLYRGDVANTNKEIETLLRMTRKRDASRPDFAEVKRRLGWEWNGMRLHELYFDNLGGSGVRHEEDALDRIFKEQYGS